MYVFIPSCSRINRLDLVAYVVSKFEAVSGKTKRGVDVAIWTQPGKTQLGKYALNATASIIEYYESLFQIEYPLPKADLMAIPDFAGMFDFISFG